MKVAVEDLVHSHEADLMFESKEDHDERHRDEREKGDPKLRRERDIRREPEAAYRPEISRRKPRRTFLRLPRIP